MRRALALPPAVFCLGLGATPAAAHPGDHSRFSFADLAAHLFEVDHLVFLALIVLVGALAYGAGRRSARHRSDRR